MTKDEKRWFAEDGGLIARWSPPSRGAVVPDGLQVLPLGADAPLDAGLVPAGAESSVGGLVLRAGSFHVPVEAPVLRDSAGFPGRFTVTLHITAPTTRTAALLLRDRTLQSRDRFSIADLATLLSGPLESRLRNRLAAGAWDGVGGVMETFRQDQTAAEIFREPLFELGLTLRGISGFTVESDELDDHRQRQSELKRRAGQVRDRLEFLDLWKREEMGQALARDEVERLAAHLRREGTLREMEAERELTQERIAKQHDEARERGRLRRMLERERIATEADIDEERLGYEIEKAKRLHEVLEKHGLLAVVSELGDSPDHARLLELLVERDMTPEQLAAKAAGEARWEEIEDRLEALAAQMHPRNSTIAEAAEQLPNLREIWLAAGVSLYRLPGVSAFNRAAPTPVLPPSDIGFLRSVSVVRNGAGRAGSGKEGVAILTGAQSGVGVYCPNSSHWGIYRYRPVPQGRGGANSVALSHGRVLASHSELGMHAWSEANSPTESRAVNPSRLCEAPTRGVQCGDGDVVYVGQGAEVLSLRGSGHEVVSLGVLPSSVTALCYDAGELVAGTRDGQIFRWDGGTRWSPLPFRSTGPVFRIAATGGRGSIRWVVGARMPAVHVLDSAGQLVEEYRSRYPIRWVAAGREGVLGVDRFGQELQVWSWDDPAAPKRRIRVPAQIQSLDVERGDAC